MSAKAAIKTPPGAGNPGPEKATHQTAPDVMVFVEGANEPGAVIGHAKAVAKTFGAGLVLVSVIEPPGAEVLATDPVEWAIRRREVAARLAVLAREFETEDCEISAKVLEGQPADQICDCAAQGSHDVIVVSRGSGAEGWRTNKVALGVMAADVGAILVVPATPTARKTPAYSRILVPLDGSSLAESAIPKAAKLARAHDAELILCHVTPAPVLTELGPVDPETVRLKERIAQHNRRVGLGYLDRIKGNLKDCGLLVSTRLVIGGDARRKLIDAIAESHADIVVMASHGKSAHADVSAGDVAGFILDRSAVPVLIVRQPQGHRDQHIVRGTRPEGVRHPADMVK